MSLKQCALAPAAISLLAIVACNPFKPFESQEGRFRVLMPKEPQYEARVIDPEDGTTVHLYRATYAATVYLVAHTDFPAGGRTPAEVLADGRANALAAASRKLLSERQITLQGHPGLELVIQEGNTLMYLRSFYVGSRSYQVSVTGQDHSTVKNRAPEFLDSFAIH
jgi:hypothetical protein